MRQYLIQAPSMPTIFTQGLLLRDDPSDISSKERHFYDLYHLFLNKFARLTYNASLKDEEAEILKEMLKDVLEAKKRLERD